jgi:hypothetical protein
MRLFVAGLKTVIEDEDDLIRHSEHGKALIFAFNPHDMVRFRISQDANRLLFCTR